MLGIRRYVGRSIDLWCGRRDQFVADVVADELDAGFQQAIKENARHLAIWVDAKSSPDEVFKQLRQLLDETAEKQVPARITFAFAELSDYRLFQSVFFEHFE